MSSASGGCPRCTSACAGTQGRIPLVASRLIASTFVDAFEPAEWADVEELVVDIARDHPALLTEEARSSQQRCSAGRRIRLALPPLTRKWEETMVCD